MLANILLAVMGFPVSILGTNAQLNERNSIPFRSSYIVSIKFTVTLMIEAMTCPKICIDPSTVHTSSLDYFARI